MLVLSESSTDTQNYRVAMGLGWGLGDDGTTQSVFYIIIGRLCIIRV